ncbi:hypothetical protein JOLEMLAF_JOLEMLAF_02616 [Staphylococcus aureus]|nr:hypothetical protein JOLEMLAF_JOLEMLAF_02616 [Staphylococcus aureus]
MYKNFDLFLGIVSLLSATIIYIIDSDSKGIALVVLIMGIVFILTSMIRKKGSVAKLKNKCLTLCLK